MAWSTPRTWVTGEVVTSAHMNTEVRDNLTYLFNINHSGGASGVPEADRSTNSTSFVDMGGVDVPIATFPKRGGTETQLFVHLYARGYVTDSAADSVQLGIRVDSTDYSNAFPHFFNDVSSHQSLVELVFVTGLTAGTKTIKPRVKLTGGTATFHTDGNDFIQITIVESSI